MRRAILAAAALCLAWCLAPAGASAFGVQSWEAGTCTAAQCTAASTGQLYTQAAGVPPYAVAEFRMQSRSGLTDQMPEGHVKDVRVDLPPGLSVNPEAVEQCSEAQLEKASCPAGSRVGVDDATGTAALTTAKYEFPIYDMQPKMGEPARLAIDARSPTLALLGLGSLLYLEGGVSWHGEPSAPGQEASGVLTGDLHDYFRMRDIPEQPGLIASRLVLWGLPHEHDAAAPDRAFIQMPSACEGPQTTWLHVDSYEDPGHYVAESSTTPTGLSGCGAVAAHPQIAMTTSSSTPDAPDGPTVTLSMPGGAAPGSLGPPALRGATITLPEGMTLDPSAAPGLQACTDAQLGRGEDAPVACPAKSIIGSASLSAPGLGGGLAGDLYLGAPRSSQPASGSEYRLFLALEDPGRGVAVRLVGGLAADPATGRLQATFSDLPPIPFERLALTFSGGADAPLANPLACGPATVQASVSSYSDPGASVDAQGNVGFGPAGCSGAAPFSVSQRAIVQPSSAGGDTSLTLSYSRAQGDQYLSTLDAKLPEGLLGMIPTVPRCGAPAAAAGTCGAASEIGAASIVAGSGPSPLRLAGAVYLTGPFGGAPYGLSIAIPAQHVGPFDYGTVVIRAAVGFDPRTARLEVRSDLPRIVGGVPLRLRSVSIAIDRRGFLVDPTSCDRLQTSTEVESTLGAVAVDLTPFAAGGCGSLAFAPRVSAQAGARSSRGEGLGLSVRLRQPAGQARIRSVAVTLPRTVSPRLVALMSACLRATFVADPRACPSGSVVGSARVSTPALPGTMTGHAYLVSHGAEFPDLDLVLRDHGVTFDLVGRTSLSARGMRADFATLPDVPIASFDLSLSTGSHALLGTRTSPCVGTMRVPIAVVSQNGRRLRKAVPLQAPGCELRLLSRRIRGGSVVLRVRARAAGRVTLRGGGLLSTARRLAGGRTRVIVVRLTRRAAQALRRRRRLKTSLTLRFAPRRRGGGDARLAVPLSFGR